MGFRVRVQGLEFWGLRSEVEGSGLRVYGLEVRGKSSGLRVQGLGFRFQGPQFMVEKRTLKSLPGDLYCSEFRVQDEPNDIEELFSVLVMAGGRDARRTL